jgi:hypothetical protein
MEKYHICSNYSFSQTQIFIVVSLTLISRLQWQLSQAIIFGGWWHP